jgi:NitT/TauT family transport system substrate-binding protein
MDRQDSEHWNWSRREFVNGLTLASAVSFLGWQPPPAAAEPPPETPRLRMVRYPFDVACAAPQWVAEELLRAEGFSSVEYVMTTDPGGPLATGEADLTLLDPPGVLLVVDAGKPIVALAGVHGGCYELFATEQVRSVRDLRGRTVAVAGPGRQAFVAAMASHVGLDPRKDIAFVVEPEAKQLFIEGKVDAVLGFPPEPQELRARKIGHVLVNTALDRPWSQYFCCFATANRTFVQKHPVATKRALRAIVKATDICAAEPERIARLLVDRGFIKDYDYSLQVLKEVPYRRWLEYDSADTIRFFALRMHEAGVIKASPQKLIAQGTDWRFVNELKKELKG